ncbi:Pentatricopeptide repeat-containing protein [Thalictrum thalictroides]|uniref:Pentatricopeptide repeat-containing protein n=1 Tax=Thalictrum thalictroides TaxID=46969 RepID=A0A7J6VD71_THATH|nr:Pentatricopeptide repeat-containing protein [Thalictrum thalictroides]
MRRRDLKLFLNQPLPRFRPTISLQRSVIKLLHCQVCAQTSIKGSFFTVKTSFLKPEVFHSNYKLFCTNQSFNEKINLLSSSGDKINTPHEDFSSIQRSNFASSVISRCSYLWEKKGENIDQVYLRDILLKLSDIEPKLIRRFWRVSILKPNDVVEILRGFEFDCGEAGVEAKKVGFLWELFKWAKGQIKDFEHLPKTYEIMASMLTRVGLLNEAETLVRTMDARGVLLGGHDVFSKIIEGHAGGRELKKSVLLYNLMRSRGLVPSESCYRVLLNLLIGRSKTNSAFRVCMDMVERGLGLSNENMSMFEAVVKLLCKRRKVKEARNVLRKLVASDLEPSSVVVNLIANGYSEKKDFIDLLNFLKERKRAPDSPVCHKILSSLCRNFGSNQAYLFMVELESLGFTPDEVTFGIFISWSCVEGKLKDAFKYLSELLSRCLKPDLYCYNALLSGLFKSGMWKYASEISHEMLEMGITPDLSTFKVHLAGYCKFRRFNEAKAIILEMMNQDLVQLSPLEDPLSKAFLVLGFKPSAVKLKRDNDAGLKKAEFFDSLGNGLYLETDINRYEETVLEVLEDAMFPDFNSHILKECNHGNIKTALLVKDHMICRGQKLSLSAYSALMKGLCLSRSYVMKAVFLFEEMPEFAYQLDQEMLNLFVRVISKKGFPQKGKIILERMIRWEMSIENETYTTLIMGLCKKGFQNEVQTCLEFARNHQWIPRLKDCRAMLDFLCHHGMFQDVLMIFESLQVSSSHSVSDISNIFFEVLCGTGQASAGQILLSEFLRLRGDADYTAYSHLIIGLCKEKSFEEAIGILDIMLEKNMTPCVHIYSQLISYLCRYDRLEKAMALKEIMLRKESVSCLSVYGLLVNGLCGVGKIQEATVQFQEMITKGVSPDSDTLNVMIRGHCQDNNLRRVWELLSIMIRNEFSLSILSYRNLVKMMCMHGRMSLGLSLKEILLRETDSSFVVVYNILIFQYLRTGTSSFVPVLLDEMKKKGLMLDEIGYNYLICGYCTCQDVSRSLELLKSMIDKDLRPSKRSLKMVIRHLCNHGNINKALELTGVMEVRGWVHGSVVQHAIVENLLSHGRLQEAENYLVRVADRGLVPNSISYDNLIIKFCQYGRLEVAVDLLDIMLKKGNLPRPSCYDSVIQGFCIRKAVDDALNFHAEMLAKDFKPNTRSWDMLIHELITNGRTVESENLLNCMNQLGQTPTASMFQVVIDRYCVEDNHIKASELIHKMQKYGYVPDFKTHWSLVSNLSNSKKDNTENGGGSETFAVATMWKVQDYSVSAQMDGYSNAHRYVGMILASLLKGSIRVTLAALAWRCATGHIQSILAMMLTVETLAIFTNFSKLSWPS